MTDVTTSLHGHVVKGGDLGVSHGLLLKEELASYQLVGEVTAHQGEDG